MTRIIPRLLLNGALMGALLCPATLYALGLGEIRLNSALSQPFDAEVELVNPTVEELNSITVGLASAEAFARFGLERPSFLSSFVFKVTPVGGGQAVIRIVSTRPVTEPVVSFLLEVGTAGGRQLREYTVFLDPPVFVPAQPAPREQVSGVTPPPVEESRTQGVIERAPVAPEAVTPAPPPPVTEPLPTPTPAPVETRPEPVAAEPTPEPALTPAPAEPEPVVPPPVTEPAPAEPVAAEAEPVVPAPAAPLPDSHEVQRGESLWKIAERLRAGGVEQNINQTMIAVYKANPEAFVGNINRLRAGAVLRIPSAEEFAAVDRREANREVARQYEEWRPTPAPTPVEAVAEDREHLRLVTPTEPTGASASAAAAERARAEQAAAEAAAAEKARAEEAAKAEQAARAAAEREAKEAEAKRLLELQNAELARLQQERERRAAEEAARAAAAETPAPAPTEEVVATPAAEPAQPAAQEAKPAAQQQPLAPPEPSFLESLVGALGQYGTYILIGLAVVLLGGTGIYFSRRRQLNENALAFPVPSGEPTLTPSDFDAVMDDVPQAAARSRSTAESTFDEVQESAYVPAEEEPAEAEPAYSKPAPAAREPARAAAAPVDDILAGEPAAQVDQQDAIAEADFHMAYGLYDQAADLVKIAIGRDPKRRDLKLKLVEIYFVWGNKDLFLDAARELYQTRSQAPAGEWDKILIMGKQIAPEDGMFKGGAIAAPGQVDVNLEGGENRVDYDLFASPESSQAAGANVDFDLAASTTGATGAQEVEDLDFLLDESAGAPQKGKAADKTASTQEMPTIESRVLKDVGARVSEPMLDLDLGGATDQTAELSIDDLGLDVGGLEASGPLKTQGAAEEIIGDDELTRIAPSQISEPAPAKSRPSLEPTMEVPQMASGARKPNGHDDEATETGVDTVYLEELSAEGSSADESALMLAPSDLELDNPQLSVTDAADDDTIRSKAARADGASEATAEMPKIRPPSAADLAVTQEQPRLEIGGGGRSDVLVATTEVPELEPVTMSEVGTKLDLARAYMDMGDPDGARSILEEVLGEGNSGQRAEAQRLLDSIR